MWKIIIRKYLNRIKIIKFFKRIILKDSAEEEYNFIFFKVSKEMHSDIKDKVMLEIEVASESAVVILNEYMNKNGIT